MNMIQKFEQNQKDTIQEKRNVPEFQAGDTVRVNVRIIEGNNERIQAFEGVCIACRNRGLNSSFTVRKLSHGEGVERVFPLYSPRLDSIEVVRRGDVRRAKLYYLRGLTGKAARIREKMDFTNSAVSDEDKKAKSEAKNQAKASRKAEKAEKKAAAATVEKKARKPKKSKSA